MEFAAPLRPCFPLKPLCAVCFFPVMSTTLLELGILPNAALLLLVSRVIVLVVNLSYYHHLGRKPKKM